MTPGQISKQVVTDRLDWVARMLTTIRALPLDSRGTFLADYRNVAAAESCLRRALEALFDLGRHMLAKGFGQGVSEYKAIATELGTHGVLSATEVDLLRVLAGYRNRMVYFYNEISPDELLEVCRNNLSDIETIAAAYQHWLQTHPDTLDDTL